jgi:hypothetical protein
VVVIVIGTMVLTAVVLLVVQVLQGGGADLIYGSLVLATASVFVPDVARLLARRSAARRRAPERPVGPTDATGRVAPISIEWAEPTRIEWHEIRRDHAGLGLGLGLGGDDRPEPARDREPAPEHLRPADPAPTGLGEVPRMPGPPVDPPDFANEPIFDPGPVVAAPRPHKPADAGGAPAAGAEAEPVTLAEVAQRLARVEATVDALLRLAGAPADSVARGDRTTGPADARPQASPTERPQLHRYDPASHAS